MYQEVVSSIWNALEGQMSFQEIERLVEKPKYEHQGDLAFPCFTLAKVLKKSPNHIAQELSNKIKSHMIDRTEVVGSYLNFFLNRQIVTEKVLKEITNSPETYGQKEKKNQNVVIDFSSPNIAKPFSMGHLRSTVIGNALANIAEKNGYQVIRINHLGDWGTQFGKLIVAYQLWGNKEAIEKSPIEQLLKLYVKFHEEAEQNEQLNDQARAAFKSLEQNDKEALALWRWFKEASLEEFQVVYELLNIHLIHMMGKLFITIKCNVLSMN